MLLIELNDEFYEFKDEIFKTLLNKVSELHNVKIVIRYTEGSCYISMFGNKDLEHKVSKILYDEFNKIHEHILDELMIN